MDEAPQKERAVEEPTADRSRPEPPADGLLADVYPRDRDRERAARWLGWVAYHWGAEPVAWWEIPARVPGRWLARTRFTVAVAIAAGALGAAIGFTLWVGVTLLFLAVLVFARTGLYFPRTKLLRIPRPGPPRRVKPRWPRGRGAVVRLAASLIPVVTFAPVLLRQWTGPAGGDATQAYRADRRTTAARLAAWLASAGLVAAIVLGAGAPAGVWLGVDFSLAAGAGLLAALTAGPYPMVKLTELILLGQWRQPVSLYRVLADATGPVLMLTGERWEFRDEAVRAVLAAAHAAELRERDRAREARAARTTGARVRLVAALDARRIARARADLAAGLAIFFLLLGLTLAHGRPLPSWWRMVGVFAAVAAVAGLIGYAIAPRLLRPAVACVRWTVVNV
ncbi:MAG: hypothetical protein ACRDOI_12560, partial [Trebonia sp.]